jgi:hypothetical protein
MWFIICFDEGLSILANAFEIIVLMIRNLKGFKVLTVVGMGYNAVQSVDSSTDFSEEHIDFLVAFFMLVFLLTYSFTPNMEATCSSETTVVFHRIIRRYIPENETHCDFEVRGWPHENRI